MYWAIRNEADLQAAEPQASQQARVPCEDEDPRRTCGIVASTPERSCAPRREGGRQVDPRGSDAGAPGSAEGLPAAARIRHTKEIRALLERGKRKRTPHVEVFLAPSPALFCRLGVIVPKHRHRIVERNKLKRRLREIGRRRVLPRLAAKGFVLDVLVRARPRAYEADFDVLAQEVMEAVEAACSAGL